MSDDTLDLPPTQAAQYADPFENGNDEEETVAEPQNPSAIKVTKTLTEEATRLPGQKSPLEDKEKEAAAKKVEDRFAYLDLGGIPKKDHDFVKHLEELSLTGSDGLKVIAIRKSPPMYKNNRYVVNRPLREYDPASFFDIRQQVIEEFGGGTFELKLIRPKGDIRLANYDLIRKMNFHEDTTISPPKPDTFTTAGITGKPAERVDNTISAEEEAARKLSELRTTERELDAQGQIIDRQQEIWRKQKAIEDERTSHEERQLRKDMGPIEAQRQQYMEMKQEMDRERNRADDRMVAMMDNMQRQTKDMVDMMTRSKGDGESNGNMMLAISSMMAKMMEVMGAKKDDNGHMEKLMEMQSQHNQTMITMMQQSSEQANARIEAANARSEGMVDKLLTQRIESPQEQIASYLAMRKEGKEEAKEFFEMVQSVQAQAQSGGDDDEINWDPNAGVMGNLGALAFHGIKRLVNSASSEEGMKMIATLNKMFRKGATNRSFSNEEIAAAAEHIGSYMGGGDEPTMGYGTVAGQVLPDNQPQLAAAPSHPMAYNTNRPNALPYTPPQHRPSNAIVPAPGVRMTYTVNQPMQPAAAPQPAVTYQAPPSPHPQRFQPSQPVIDAHPLAGDPDVEFDPVATAQDRLRNNVTDMLAEALEDITDGRHTHQWPYSAVEFLSGTFLDQLCSIPDDNQRIQLIRQYADPTLFQRLMNVFWNQGGAPHFHNFRMGLQALTGMHMERKQNATTQFTTAPAV